MPKLRDRLVSALYAIGGALWLIVIMLGLLLGVTMLISCSLTPAPSPAPLQAAVWCPEQGSAWGCDAGMAVSLAAWRWDEQDRYIGPVAMLGGETLGAGVAVTVLRGSTRTPTLAAGVGWAMPYDPSAGVAFADGALVIGVTAGWGQ